VNLTAALYERLVGDAALAGLLAEYQGQPAVFTVDPAPADAALPYIVTAGSVVDTPWDTKTTRGRQVWRDVRCYAPATGSAVTVEAMAERVRALLHRDYLEVEGHVTYLTDVHGPIVADETEAYGRILTVRLTLGEV
jgi:hypothetical protein